MKITAKQYWELFIVPLAQQKGRLGQMLFALVSLSLIQGIAFVLLGPFSQALFSSGSKEEIALLSLLPAAVQRYFPLFAGLVVSKSLLLYIVPGGLLGVALLRNGANYLYGLSSIALSLHLSRVYRQRFFSQLIKQSFLEIQKKSPAMWMSHIMNDVLYLEMRFAEILNSFVRDSVVMVSALFSLSIIHPPTALIISLVAPLIAFGMGRTGKRIANYAEDFQQELSNLANHILELRRHFYYIRSQKGEARELQQFSAINQRYYQRVLGSILVRSAFAPLVEWFGFATFALFAYLVSRKYLQDGNFPLGNLLMFFAALGLMLRPLRNLGEQLAKFHETKGALAKSLYYLSSWKAAETVLLEEAFARVSETVSVTRCRSGYSSGEIKLEVEHVKLVPRRSVVLVGPSGSGKSTLIKTLTGLISAQSWEASLSQGQLASRISMVSQAPFLFSGSIRENLLYGQEDTVIGEEEIWRVLAMVAMAETVTRLPGQLAYPLDSLSATLSGGQVQRLVIARALLRGKDFLLLDEATSAIDEATEREITTSLLGLCQEQGIGILAITHRLQLIALYDEVWFMEAGKISKIVSKLDQQIT